MRILLVTEFFPPENAIASLRLYSFAKYWHQSGHDITTLTTLKKTSSNALDFDCSFIKIIRIAIPFASSTLISGSNLVSNAGSNTLFSGNVLKTLVHPVKKTFIWFRDKTGCFSLRFPHFCDLWAKKALNFVNACDYDIVLTSGGPYSVLHVGFALKKKNPKIKWIIDWRDLWTKNHHAQGLTIFHPYEIYLENKFHKNADLITTISEPLKNILMSMTKTPVKTIYNGFDTDDYTEIRKHDREKSDYYHIVYTGSFYRKLYDPSPFFKAVSQLKKRDISLYNKLKIQFAGPNSDISDIVLKYGILDSFTYLGFIKREDSLKLQYNADAVLFIVSKSKTDGILSGKIFEYMYNARKIIAIGDKVSYSSIDLITETNTGVYLGSDPDFIEKYLIECITNKNSDIKQKKDAYIRKYSRKNQADKFLNYIQQI